MNIRYVISLLGRLFMVLGIILLAISGWSGLQLASGQPDEKTALQALLVSAAVAVGIGSLMWFTSRTRSSQLGRREALLLVAASWLIGAGVAGLPYFLWASIHASAGPSHAFANMVNCYFEAMSGLTTTGATVLTGIHLIPKSILLWRATTHWLGGLGVVVLFVAVLPSLGVGGKKLFRVEAPGPEPEGVHPHIRETARILWMIYVGLTVIETVVLRLAGMTWFDAICHTFATLATGGFSTIDASIGGYNHSLAIDIIVIVFMVLAGVNFGLYYQLIRRRFSSVWQDAELRLYLGILLAGSAVVVISIFNSPITLTTGESLSPSTAQAIRQGVFTTVSLQTTTGFCTADFNLWPFLSKAVLVLLMFVGGSAGSTGGGIKVIRILIAFKVMVAELERVFRPNVVRPIRINNTTISPELKLGTIAYVLGIVLIFGAGTGLLMLLQPTGTIEVTTAATATAATLCNIGPGLAKVGAVENYAWFTNPSKVVMCILMALGRLEVFAIIVLFVPRFWRNT